MGASSGLLDTLRRTVGRLGCVSQMSTPPRHPRDRGGRFTLKNQDDGSPIREQIVLGDRLLMITEKCIYAIQMADQIDPDRTNPNLPHNFQQKLFDHGVNSELLCRSLLHAKVMFRKEFQLIEIERAMQLAFDVFGELVAMDEVARTFKAAEAAAIEKAQGLRRTDGSLALPAVGSVRAHCKTFAQRADHGAGALLDIIRLFYELKKKNWVEFQEVIKAKYGEADNFYKVLEMTVPFLRMIRNARDCLEHRNVMGATTYDFMVHADGKVGVPSIEINFRGSVVERCPVSEFMAGAIRTLLDSFEMITVHLCAKNMKRSFAGMPMTIAPLPDDYKRAWRLVDLARRARSPAPPLPGCGLGQDGFRGPQPVRRVVA
jgi:hypothetical protein